MTPRKATLLGRFFRAAGNWLSHPLVVALILLAIGVIGIRSVGPRPPAETPALGVPAVAAAPEPPAAPGTEKAKDILEVTGRVVGPDGKPVAGARLVIPVVHASDRDKPIELARSAADGSFRCEIPLPDEDERKRSVGLLHAYAPGFAAAWLSFGELRAGKPVTLRLAPDDVPVRGRIVDPEGKPVPGVEISINSIAPIASDAPEAVLAAWRAGLGIYPKPDQPPLPDGPASPECAGVSGKIVTDADGRFEIRGIGRGRFVCFTFQSAGFEKTVSRILTLPGFDTKSLTRNTDRTEALPNLYGPEFVHRARHDAVISGTVTDAKTGKPIEMAVIFGEAEKCYRGNQVFTTTDADGRYRLTGWGAYENRRLTVEAHGDLPNLEVWQDVPDVSGAAETTADVRLPRGVVVKGRVTNRATGLPVASARVTYWPLKFNRFFAAKQGVSIVRSSGGAITDEDGSFHFVAPPGPAVVTAGEPEDSVDPVGYKWVSLRDADRRWFEKQGQKVADSYVEEGGRGFILLGKSAYQIIEPAEGAESIEMEFQFEPAQWVFGKVVDLEGKPATNVSGWPTEAPDPRPFVLPDGRFTAQALDQAGPRLLAFTDEDRKLAAAILLTGDEAQPLVVRLRSWAALNGRVVDAVGKPRSGLDVGLLSTEKPYIGLGHLPVGGNTKTDAAGRFRVDVPFADVTMAMRFLRKDGSVLETPRAVSELKLRPGETRDLGDIVVKEK
jgi:protocatechuate 3,4-dioxygenase beta subunit